MDAMLVQKREQCRLCNETAPSNQGEEMVLADPPTFPFEVVALDFLSSGEMTISPKGTGTQDGWIYTKCLQKLFLQWRPS